MPSRHLVAVTAADLHLSARAPLARSGEADWLAVQVGYLRQLWSTTLTKSRKEWNNDPYPAAPDVVPCLLAGDLFDKAVVSPEIVNAVLKSLPEQVYAVAGNHDLLHHNLDSLAKTSYGTLVAAGTIIDLKPHKPVLLDGAPALRLWGWPCGAEVEPCPCPHDLYVEIALVHAYVWSDGTGYPGADEEQRLRAYRKRLTGYDVVLFGDNHKTVTWNLDRRKENLPAIFNPGTFMRRKQDERGHRPLVGLLYSDGTVEPHYLDTSADQFVDGDEVLTAMNGIGAESFVEALLELGDSALDFREAVTRLLERKKVDPRVKQIILTALEKGER